MTAAIERYGSDGRAATAAYYNNPANVEGISFFMIDENNKLLAIPSAPQIAGKNASLMAAAFKNLEAISEASEKGQWDVARCY